MCLIVEVENKEKMDLAWKAIQKILLEAEMRRNLAAVGLKMEMSEMERIDLIRRLSNQDRYAFPEPPGKHHL